MLAGRSLPISGRNGVWLCRQEPADLKSFSLSPRAGYDRELVDGCKGGRVVGAGMAAPAGFGPLLQASPHVSSYLRMLGNNVILLAGVLCQIKKQILLPILRKVGEEFEVVIHEGECRRAVHRFLAGFDEPEGNRFGTHFYSAANHWQQVYAVDGPLVRHLVAEQLLYRWQVIECAAGDINDAAGSCVPRPFQKRGTQ